MLCAECELAKCLSEFQEKMRARLEKKEADGYYGWDDPNLHKLFMAKAGRCIRDGEFVDAANFCMMAWNLSGRKDK